MGAIIPYMERRGRPPHEAGVLQWTSRQPVLMWTLAWGATGLCMKLAGVFDALPTPGHTPAVTQALPGWIAFLVGTVCWSVAGSTTVTTLGSEPTRNRILIGAVVWGMAFVWLASFAVPLGAWIQQTQFGSVYLPGFVGMLVAWSGAAALAATVTTRLVKREPGLVRPIAMGFRWGFSFFFGGYLGVPLASILGQTSEAAIGASLGEHVAYSLGWTVASLLAGLMAGAAALSIGRSQDARRDRRATDRMS